MKKARGSHRADEGRSERWAGVAAISLTGREDAGTVTMPQGACGLDTSLDILNNLHPSSFNPLSTGIHVFFLPKYFCITHYLPGTLSD